MICKNCSHENAPEEKVCTNCGSPLTEEEITESEITEIEEIETIEAIDEIDEIEPIDEVEEISEQDISAEDVADEVAKAVVSKEEKPKKSKISPFSGLIALIIIAIGLWVSFTGILAPKYDIPVDRSDFDISYVKDGSLYQKPVSGSSVKLSEALSTEESGFMGYSYTIKQSSDGKTTYFLENFNQETFSGTLYVTYNGKTKVKIADDVVQGYSISDNGKTVVYMSNIDANTAMGSLYYYKKGGEPQLIANASLYQTYLVSQNGKAITFLENVDGETGLGELYVVKAGSKPVKIDDAVAVSVKLSDKGEVFYLKNMDEMSYTYELYKASASKAPELISAGVAESYVMTSKFSNNLAFVSVSEDNVYDFNYYKAKSSKTSVAMDDLVGFFAVDVENGNFLLAKMAEDADENAVNPDMYIKRKNKEAVNVASALATPQHAKASYDLKTIYYMNEYDQTTQTGTLHVRKESIFGTAKDEVIANGVSSFTATNDGKVVVYVTGLDQTTGIGTLSSYSNGKTKVLGENVFSSAYKLSQNGKAVTYLGDINAETYTGTLYSVNTKGSGTAKTIDTDVYSTFYSRSDKNAIYIKNLSDETGLADLYMWKGKGTSESIDTGVAAVLFE